MIVHVQDKRVKMNLFRKGPTRTKAIKIDIEDQHLAKGIDHSCQGVSTPYYFSCSCC